MMWILLASTLLAAAPEVTLRTAAGQTVAGTLSQLTDQNVVLQTAAGETAVDLKQVLKVSFSSADSAGLPAPQVWVDLADGSQCVGTGFLNAGGTATLKTLDGGELKIPSRLVESVRLKDQPDQIARRWEEILAAPRGADLIVIRRDNAIDFLDGVLGEVTEEEVKFTLDGDVIPVKLTKVQGLVYFHRQSGELPDARCRISNRDGSVYLATQLKLDDQGQLALTTPAGFSTAFPLDRIRELDFSQGKLFYLSDLDPESVSRDSFFRYSVPQPRLDRFYQPQRDAAFGGTPLRLGQTTYAKGISVKSGTTIVYRLPGTFSRFQAVAGIDASVAPLEGVHLSILGDDKPLYEADISGADEPREIELDIQDVKRLTVRVGHGADGRDVADYLDLCEARITK